MRRTLLAALAALSFWAPTAHAAELRIGASSVSITPDRPVALAGQMHTRVARSVESPSLATALAIESRDGETSVDQAVLISCDLVAIPDPILNRTRELLAKDLPGFDPRKLILSATHTHTAPVMIEGDYEIPGEGIIRPGEYSEFLARRLCEATVSAWKSRKPGKVGWGLGHAVLAQNRRAVYADGRAQMYGATDRPDFREIEGPEDQGVEALCAWDSAGTLFAVAINVATPAQEVEGNSSVNADFWHETRVALKSKYGKDLHVLGWTGAAGDQSPHLMYRKRAEDRMRALRGLTRLQELADRVVKGFDEAYEGARKEQHADAPLLHRVATLELPLRKVTEAEAAEARAKVAALSKDPRNRRLVVWHGDVIARYDAQRAGTAKPYPIEVHVLRLGDVAIATNPFELYTQFGIQMKSRSRSLQTFVIQLAGPGTYVPTPSAVKGGGYSAIVESNVVGPEGGQQLTDRTVEMINSIFPKP